MEDTKQPINTASGKIFGTSIWRVEEETLTGDLDYLAVEDPLEIVVEYGLLSERKTSRISITMRTPGNDEALAIGFLFAEGLIKNRKAIRSLKKTVTDEETKGNQVVIDLDPDTPFDIEAVDRNFYMTSSCGVCGKASIDAVRMTAFPALKAGEPAFEPSFFHSLPETLLNQQRVFEHTGGLHAAALFDTSGKIQLLREDVGRHNAVDKLIGEAFLKDMLPLKNFTILLSGRISFELVQKSLMAGVPVLAAVGAPSSLAVQLANRFGMTLIGFIRNRRYNIYSGRERIK